MKITQKYNSKERNNIILRKIECNNFKKEHRYGALSYFLPLNSIDFALCIITQYSGSITRYFQH